MRGGRKERERVKVIERGKGKKGRGEAGKGRRRGGEKEGKGGKERWGRLGYVSRERWKWRSKGAAKEREGGKWCERRGTQKMKVREGPRTGGGRSYEVEYIYCAIIYNIYTVYCELTGYLGCALGDQRRYQRQNSNWETGPHSVPARIQVTVECAPSHFDSDG